MKTIRFSHFYSKLNHACEDVAVPPKTAMLLEVFLVDSRDLHKRFIEYDTSYFDKKEQTWKHYKLPTGRVLVLLFKSVDLLFTTIRRYTPRKYDYYRNCRGELFNIVVEEDL